MGRGRARPRVGVRTSPLASEEDWDTGKPTYVGGASPSEATVGPSAGSTPGRRTAKVLWQEEHWMRIRAGISAPRAKRSRCPQPGQRTLKNDGETEEGWVMLRLGFGGSYPDTYASRLPKRFALRSLTPWPPLP